MGDLLIQKMADEIQYILVLKVHTLVPGLFTLSHYQSPCDKCNNQLKVINNYCSK